MDMFIKEVQRMQPVATVALSRRCTQAANVCGMDIPEDMVIAVDLLSLHYNPEYWENPNTFNPQRFDISNQYNKLAYMPFGLGSRICVGMKFALLEMKVCLAKLLKLYDIVAPGSGLAKLEVKEGAVRRPKNGVHVVVKKRTTA